MSLTFFEWAIKVTHEPTGISKTITNRDMRSQHKAKLLAIKLVKSKVHYLQTIGKLDDVYPENWEQLLDIRVDSND